MTLSDTTDKSQADSISFEFDLRHPVTSDRDAISKVDRP